MIRRDVRKELLVQGLKPVADGNACGVGIGTHLRIAIDDPAFDSTDCVAAKEIGVAAEGKVVIWLKQRRLHETRHLLTLTLVVRPSQRSCCRKALAAKNDEVPVFGFVYAATKAMMVVVKRKEADWRCHGSPNTTD
jgi:hypothetical protein